MEKLLNDLMMAFPGNKLSVENLAVYAEYLSDIPEAVLAKAVRNIIVKSTFFPKVAEIRAEAERVAHETMQKMDRELTSSRVRWLELTDLRARWLELTEQNARDGVDLGAWQELLQDYLEQGWLQNAQGIQERIAAWTG